MPVDDLWYSSIRRDPVTKKKLPTKRHGRGKRYRVRYINDAGVQATKLFDKIDPAEQFDAAVRTDVDRGLFIDPQLGRETLSSYSRRYRESRLYRGSTAQMVERAFRLHIEPVLGKQPINAIRPTHIQSWIKEVDLAASAARVVYSVLCSMFSAAVRDRVIAVSPCVGITLPQVEHTERLILTPAQVHAIADGMPERYRAAIYLGAGCGLRHGEVLGLEKSNVDFLRREVHVVQQLTAHIGKPPHLAPPKTRTSKRTVELPKVTATALARHLEKFPVKPVELVDETNPRKPVTRSAELLFTNSSGLPLYRSAWSKTWAPVAAGLKLPPKTGFHSLRHYYATLLIFSGASVKTVQASLGHATPVTTLNEYVGLWPEQLDRTRSLVDAALGDEPVLEATE